MSKGTRLGSYAPKIDVKGTMEGQRVVSWYYNEPRHRDLYVEIKLATGEWTLVHVRLPR